MIGESDDRVTPKATERPIAGRSDHPTAVTPAASRFDSRSALVFSLGLLLVAATVLFFAGLGRLPLIEPDEGRNAEVGREMLASGDWVTPHYNGFAYLDKPAVYFWMVAASMKMFGVSEAAARLPSALMALATTLATTPLLRRLHPIALITHNGNASACLVSAERDKPAEGV